MGISRQPDPRDRYVICTSSTQPAVPFEGLMIYETDTDRVYIYNGTVWRYVAGGTDPTAARGYASGVTSISVSAATKVTLASEAYDYGNNFASSTYTCPRDGLLDVRSRVAVSSATDGQRFLSYIYVNGAETSRGSDRVSGGTGDVASVAADQLPVVANDTIELYARLVGGTAKDTSTASTYLACRMVP